MAVSYHASMNSDVPQFAVLTPPGRGAIATVAIRGNRALPVVAARFQPASGKPLIHLQPGRVVFGRFQTSAASAEDLVVGLIGNNEAEIHCHGGAASIQAICDALESDGCRRVASSEWAYLQEPEPIAAEALLALADARTERTAAILLDQYLGALRSALLQVEQLLLAGDEKSAVAAIADLLSRANLGLHLTQPWKVVIAGPPNAGKSSLMNAFLGYQRSIVWQEPGTTRDVLTATTAFDGWPVELIDTAGLRDTTNSLEAEGVTRAHRQIGSADLVLFVIDVTAPRGAGLWPAAVNQVSQTTINTLLIHNKCDLPHSPCDHDSQALEISALTGQGLETLCHAIADRLVPHPPPPSSAVPFTRDHITDLNTAQEALARHDLSAAIAYLKPLLR